MPDGFHLITYVGGGSLGLVLCGVLFFPFHRGIAFGALGLSLVYLLGGSVVFSLWRLIE